MRERRSKQIELVRAVKRNFPRLEVYRQRLPWKCSRDDLSAVVDARTKINWATWKQQAHHNDEAKKKKKRNKNTRHTVLHTEMMEKWLNWHWLHPISYFIHDAKLPMAQSTRPNPAKLKVFVAAWLIFFCRLYRPTIRVYMSNILDFSHFTLASFWPPRRSCHIPFWAASHSKAPQKVHTLFFLLSIRPFLFIEWWCLKTTWKIYSVVFAWMQYCFNPFPISLVLRW